MAKLLLASTSPRRAQLLREAGYIFAQNNPECPEEPHPGEDPVAQIRRFAEEKARAGVDNATPDYVILGADTAIIQNGIVHGKPRDYDDFKHTMSSFSDNTHEVVTAVCLITSSPTQKVNLFHCTTQVTFAPLSADWIREYWDSGEPRDKAGGYAIQGRARSQVKQIIGSFTNVIGLPMDEVQTALRLFHVHPQEAR